MERSLIDIKLLGQHHGDFINIIEHETGVLLFGINSSESCFLEESVQLKLYEALKLKFESNE